MSSEQRLNELRDAIDAVDDELLTLLNRRGKLTIEVGELKREASASAEFYRPEREARILRRMLANNTGPMPDEQLARLIREIISTCLSLEQQLNIAYLGPAGTYTHAAAMKHFGGAASQASQATIGDVFRAVEARACDYGVVPMENSVGGAVIQTLDCLAESSLVICGEVVLPVHHQLLSRAADKTGLKRVYAHQQALEQCRAWLQAELPQVETIALGSNAAAAVQARDEPEAAAIASVEAGRLYELNTLAQNIEDNPNNTTRFVVIGRNRPQPSGDDRTTVMFSMRNEAGALHRILGMLAARDISLSRIESRPLRNGVWDYLFFIDLLGHHHNDAVSAALGEIERAAALFKVLGSYPRAVV